MDDLLIIVLTLIVAVIGAIGQAKKKKANQGQQPAGEKPDSFWDLLQTEPNLPKDDDEEGRYAEEENFRQPEPAPVKEVPNTKFEKRYQFRPENEGVSIYGDDLTKEVKTEKKKVNKQLKDFSLRKAVIYSEILNRKYQ